MLKLKPITENSWLIFGDSPDEKVGLLSRQDSDVYSLLSSGTKQKFNRKSLIAHFNQDIFQNVDKSPVSHTVKSLVIGFPTDCEVVYPAYSSVDLPLYTKSEKSDVKYGAGYYCVKYNFNWVQCFCPKYSTLEKYEFKGPYKNELENKAVLSELRKDEKDRKAKE